MKPSPENNTVRLKGIGYAFFAATMFGIGTCGLFSPELMPVWNPVPSTGISHQLLAYLAIGISLATGIGLLLPRVAPWAARLLLAAFSLWLLLFRLPSFVNAPWFAACWLVFPLVVMLSGSLVVYVSRANAWDQKHLGKLSSGSGLRWARTLYSLSLIFFGVAHFIDVPDTVSLVPHWLPAHLFWVYFTGSAFIVAGVAMLIGLYGRLAAALSALQIASFLFLVWIPIVAAGSRIRFQWSETFLNVALLSAAWVIADSYRGTRWLSSGSPA